MPTFDNVYNTYSPMLYGIALQISTTENEAQQLLISTFKTAYKQNVAEQTHPCVCVTLIKLLISSAQDLVLSKRIKLKQFENAPLLHKMLCENIKHEVLCEELQITRNQLSRKIQEEVLKLGSGTNSGEKFI